MPLNENRRNRNRPKGRRQNEKFKTKPSTWSQERIRKKKRRKRNRLKRNREKRSGRSEIVKNVPVEENSSKTKPPKAFENVSVEEKSFKIQNVTFNNETVQTKNPNETVVKATVKTVSGKIEYTTKQHHGSETAENGTFNNVSVQNALFEKKKKLKPNRRNETVKNVSERKNVENVTVKTKLSKWNRQNETVEHDTVKNETVENVAGQNKPSKRNCENESDERCNRHERTRQESRTYQSKTKPSENKTSKWNRNIVSRKKRHVENENTNKAVEIYRRKRNRQIKFETWHNTVNL